MYLRNSVESDLVNVSVGLRQTNLSTRASNLGAMGRWNRLYTDYISNSNQCSSTYNHVCDRVHMPQTSLLIGKRSPLGGDGEFPL